MGRISFIKASTKLVLRCFGASRALRIYTCLMTLMIMPLLAISAETEAEFRLESIKQALVDLAMQKDIKLGSSAYLDSQGILHESTVISTQTEVRGVRVIEYLEAAGAPGASLESAILRSRSCLGSQSGLRRQATIRTLNLSALQNAGSLVGDHSIGELSGLLKAQLHSATASSAQWSTTEEIDFSSDYTRFLRSRAVDEVPYSFQIELRKVATDPSTLAFAKAILASGIERLPGTDKAALARQRPWPAVKLEYQLTLIEKSTNRQLWRGYSQLMYPEVRRGYRKDAYPEQLLIQAEKVTESFVQQFTVAMECHSDHYPLAVLAGDDQRRTINAGTLAGLRIGDQFLISPSENILQQSMSLSGMSKLGLARVEAVSPHRATLVHIAGPKWTSKANTTKGFAIYF